MSGALQNFIGGGLESIHGGLKSVLKNTACEGLHSLVKLPAIKKGRKKTLWPLFMDRAQLPQGYSHFEQAVYFLPLSSQKFLVLILLTSEE